MITEQEFLDKAAAYVNGANSPEDRNLRKQFLHGMIYGAGPITFKRMFDNMQATKTNSIHRTDLNKAPAPLRSDLGIMFTNGAAKRSCTRCSQFSTSVKPTNHPIYRLMCAECKEKIFPTKPTT